MNNSTIAPPVYSSPDSGNSPGGPPPAFEPDRSAPVVLVDEKRPLDTKDDSTVACGLPQRARAPSMPNIPAPQTFQIGQKVISTFELVTIPEIRAHLAFLGAFARLKASVKSQKGPDVRGSVDELWAIYLARAVDRFAKWTERGLDNFINGTRDMKEEEVPPLDVLMAWHAYMLNPRVYYEDGMRGKSKLFCIRAFPLHLVDRILETDTLLPLDPIPERQNQFELATGQPWTAPLNTTLSDTTMVPCPRCEEKTMTEVCWVTNEDTGFAQHGFKARCHACMGVFDRHAMMVRALCDDVIKARISLEDKTGAPKTFISGTLLDWKTGEVSMVRAVRNNQVLLKDFLSPALMKFTRGDWLAGYFDYSIEKVEKTLKAGMGSRGGQQQVTRILSYYRASNYPFSIELCGAILRQGSFIDKMVGFGWTEPRTFDEEPAIPLRCIARYSAWLDVMSQLTKQMLVPTLDIDLAWHTHQLKHEAYRTQTLSILGKFVDHDDKIEENKLSDAYDQTAKYWEQRFGVPYHVCGCIHPPPRKSVDPVAAISKIFKGKNKEAPVFTNTRPQLVPTHDCDAPITHPSEHNAILVVGQGLSKSRRATREQEHAKWDKQTRTALDKGKVPPDGWEAMSVRRAEGHEQGFMRPFPDPNLMPVVPFGAETCAAYDGGVLYGHQLAQLPTDGKYTAGMCAAGMGYYGILPFGGVYIGPMGGCAGMGNGACGGGGGGGGCGGGCGGGGCGGS
ncbi:dammaradiene synthase [Ceratobasidium sp. AG-Ba]|nr:dammaradiene synthase [Ceratobasidium sp. AG-Ba]